MNESKIFRVKDLIVLWMAKLKIISFGLFFGKMVNFV